MRRAARRRCARGALAATPLLALLSLAPAAGAAGEPPLALRDDLGREITMPRAPQRIVSLLPSLTETVCALGACDRLVATDRFSNWPPEVRALPKAGGLDDAEIEAIMRLRPQLVLVSQTQRIIERLGELGVSSFALGTDSYSAIARNVTVLGEILGTQERATLLNRQIDAEVQAVSQKALSRRHGAGARVYFEVDRTPYAAGPSSFIGELLTRLGARNIAPADRGPFPQLNPEYVVRENPDVIIVSTLEAGHLAERPGWGAIRAVREKRICDFTPAVEDTVVRPGPRVAQGMRAIAGCLERVAP